MNERDELRLRHIRDAAHAALDFVEGRTRDDFKADMQLEYAVLHALQIVGEAASKISPETREQHPEIRWRDVIGIRQRIVHDYESVKIDIIWSAVVDDPPPLISQLDAILPPFLEEDDTSAPKQGHTPAECVSVAGITRASER